VASAPLLIQAKYRNKLEARVGDQLNGAGVAFQYEPHTIPFTIPARQAKYLPDFVAGKIIIESKGYFYDSARDRQKLILVRDAHPDYSVRIVFQDGNKPIYKGSKTTYGKWATDHGFMWSDKGIVPASWLKEMKGSK
jgi:hypothetical protein